MSEQSSDRPKLTVGSLLGLPLGPTTGGTRQEVPAKPSSSSTSTEPLSSADEGRWVVAAGQVRQSDNRVSFRSDGVEALTYDNPLKQVLEQVWFDGKRMFAMELGDVDVDPDRVKVAQEYQVVYRVDIDERGKLRSEPERVPGQLNIYDSIPGMEKYSPIWQFNYVIVPQDYQPNSLRSEADCLTSGYPILRSQVFEN